MKKLKKLKIIESGRICSPDELKYVRGGCSGGFTGCNDYYNCSILAYTTCNPGLSLSYGYESNGSTHCYVGYTYDSCTLIVFHKTCGSDTNYNSGL